MLEVIKKLNRGLASLVFLFVFTSAMTARAQQITAPTLPPTRNPQGSPALPFQQQSDIQSDPTDQLLERQRRITIPPGKPVPVPAASKEPGPGLIWPAAVLALAGVVLLGIWIKNSRKSQPEIIETGPETPLKINLTEPADRPKKPAGKKKLSRAQRKKGRR